MHVVHNWSLRPVEVRAPRELTDVLSGDAIGAGQPVRPGSCDVRIFTAADDAPRQP